MSRRFVRRICRQSEVYDSAHVKEVGLYCPHRHTKYFWEGVNASNFTVIGDSLLKNIRTLKQIDVQCFPGATFKKLLIEFSEKKRIDLSYPVIVVACGTNDLDNGISIDDFISDLDSFISLILQENKEATIGVASILPRPRDGDVTNDKVRQFNRKTTIYCNSKRKNYNIKIYFCQTYRNFLTKTEPRKPILSRYGHDLIHLSEEGSQVLGLSIEGHVKRLQGY